MYNSNKMTNRSKKPANKFDNSSVDRVKFLYYARRFNNSSKIASQFRATISPTLLSRFRFRRDQSIGNRNYRGEKSESIG